MSTPIVLYYKTALWKFEYKTNLNKTFCYNIAIQEVQGFESQFQYRMFFRKKIKWLLLSSTFSIICRKISWKKIGSLLYFFILKINHSNYKKFSNKWLLPLKKIVSWSTIGVCTIGTNSIFISLASKWNWLPENFWWWEWILWFNCKYDRNSHSN